MIRLAAFSDEADALLDGQIKAMLDNDISLIEIRAAEGNGVAEFTKNFATTVFPYGRWVLRWGRSILT